MGASMRGSGELRGLRRHGTLTCFGPATGISSFRSCPEQRLMGRCISHSVLVRLGTRPAFPASYPIPDAQDDGCEGTDVLGSVCVVQA